MISINSRIFLATTFATCVAITAFAGHEEDSWLFNRQGMFKAANGETEAAIKDFEKACRLNPFNDTAMANLACAHNNLGVSMAQQKNYAEAVRQFEAAKSQKPEDISIRLNLLSTLVTLKNAAEVEKEARQIITLRPSDVELILKVAAAFQKTENHSAAIAVLQELADRVSDDARVHASLGRLLYRTGNLTESEFHLQRSVELNPADNSTIKFLSRVEREAEVEKNSNIFSSVHFNLVCYESFSEEWAESLLEQLEEAYSEIGERLGFYPSQRSQVLVMQTDAFRMVHDLPDWAGGLYDGKIRLPVPGSNISPSSLRGAVMHEYTHHVIFLLSSGNCPIWLNEGLAQILENGNADPVRYVETCENIKNNTLTLIDEQFRSNPGREEAARLYRISLNTATTLVSEFGWQRITQYLNFLALGYNHNRAAQEAFAIDSIELEKICLNKKGEDQY